MKGALINPYSHALAGAYSATAQAVFDNMAALTTPEMDDMAALIDGSVTDGNWSLIDDIWCFIWIWLIGKSSVEIRREF